MSFQIIFNTQLGLPDLVNNNIGYLLNFECQLRDKNVLVYLWLTI